MRRWRLLDAALVDPTRRAGSADSPLPRASSRPRPSSSGAPRSRCARPPAAGPDPRSCSPVRDVLLQARALASGELGDLGLGVREVHPERVHLVEGAAVLRLQTLRVTLQQICLLLQQLRLLARADCVLQLRL